MKTKLNKKLCLSLLLQKFIQHSAMQNTGKTPVILIHKKVLHINTLQLGPIFTDFFFKYINDTTDLTNESALM